MKTTRSPTRHYAVYIVSMVVLLLAGCAQQTTKTTTTTAPGDSANGDAAPKSAYPAEIKGLDSPTSMAFTPDGRIFITERVGRIRVFKDGELQDEPFAVIKVPRILGYHETGLLGIAISSNYQALPYVYVYHTYDKDGALFNRVVRFKADGDAQPGPETIMDDIPGGRIHNGGILVFGPNERLFISTGDAGDAGLAQDIESTGGKVLRVNADGEIPSDNPFPGSPVYSYGHRNIFGMAIEPVTNTLFVTENGPADNDEINKIEAGKNYGWPEVTGEARDARFVDPVAVYSKSIAPTQAIFYTGDRFPEMRDTFVFGAYNTREVRAIEFAGPDFDTVVADNAVVNFDEQVIGVAQAPDGSFYVIGSNTIERIDRLER
ncbi:MAG: PQQ-dependent sugar dehydrogenase [Actinobacteria bacterium]|nr:PQQ-dependent sugar dehydrogenase [Actinomycetota bacterium]